LFSPTHRLTFSSLQSKDDDASIKIADFGFSRRVHTPQSLTTRCGTPTYVAPEILKNIPHDTKADMWSVGVITYVLLVGYPPFMEDKQQDLFRKIRSGEYEFFEEDWMEVSEEAKSLIKSLLVTDPAQRLTAAEALENPWFDVDNDFRLSNRSLTSSLRIIREKRKSLRAIAAAVMWISKDAKADPVPKGHLRAVQESDGDLCEAMDD
jgi:calcium/calmodulin-dependent protein kinase I